MKPFAIVGALLVFAVAAAMYVYLPRGPQITLTDAVLTPMGGALMLTANIDNPGGPDRLISVSSGDSAGAVLMGGSGDLAIPAGSTPSLASDGLHAMLQGVTGDIAEGRLVPVKLTFETAGDVTTRARIGAMEMDHDAVFDVPESEPKPTLSLLVFPDGGGWRIEAKTDDFTFSRDAVDGPHQPGIGHGHLYLDGLKLQRVYGPIARIGALLPGTYEMRVTLNTNDHRAYVVDGAPVTATAQIVAD